MFRIHLVILSSAYYFYFFRWITLDSLRLIWTIHEWDFALVSQTWAILKFCRAVICLSEGETETNDNSTRTCKGAHVLWPNDTLRSLVKPTWHDTFQQCKNHKEYGYGEQSNVKRALLHDRTTNKSKQSTLLHRLIYNRIFWFFEKCHPVTSWIKRTKV